MLRCLALVAILLPAALIAAPEASDTVEYNRDIRPILADKCWACHGPDEDNREGDLRLDTRAGALAANDDDERSIVPGKPDESLLIARIVTERKRRKMPPPKTNKTISAHELDLLRRWIAQGAEWQDHWSRVSPQRPAVPSVKNAAWVRNPIDAFILRQLEAAGVEPAPLADRRTLIRRLSFDLTGLPPSPEEVDAFAAVTSDSEKEYGDLVARLLRSKHYGERLAAYWLDAVRFADTNGIHGDNHREVTMYRDWVIDAFNENRPFDRFTIEQLAGDLLPDANRATRVASGYNRLLITTREGGAQPKEYLAKYAADRVRNVSGVWLGVTMGCAECHDHKFDPYTMRDFYSLEAFFADLKETAVGVQQPTKIATDEQDARLEAIAGERSVLQKTLAAWTPALEKGLEQWEAGRTRTALDWQALKPTESASRDGATLSVLDDGSILASGKSPDRDVYSIVAKTSLAGITGLRLEVLPDDSLPQKGAGRADNGNFVLNRFEVRVDGKPIAWARATATHSQNGYSVDRSTDGKGATGWAILPQIGKPITAVFEAAKKLDGDGEKTIAIEMHHEYGSRHTIGRFRLAVTAAPAPLDANGKGGVPADVAAILGVDRNARNDGQVGKLRAFYRSIAPELAATRDAITKLEKEKKAIEDAMPTTLVSMAVKPRTIRVLPRGNWLDDSGEIVAPAIPEALGKLDTGERRATRLDLAKWIVSRDNPLVARVFVNRLWKICFGRGLVKSLDDFGTQGALPTHPELLDWLAVEFIESGWNVRHMLELLVSSSSYRQSSIASKELRDRDPYNELVARQGTYRLDAEMVRDNALAVSELLVRKIGGRSVKPYQPSGYWAHLNFPRRTYKKDSGDNLYRRGLYTYWCRTFLHPSLAAFDAPTREECTVDRGRPNTRRQALGRLPAAGDGGGARALAERALASAGPAAEERIAFLYRTVLTRTPSSREVAILTDLSARHLAEYRADPDAAKASLTIGDRPAPEGDAAEHAAWTSVARVVLNLHETITRN